jgi:hypothetical protein
MIVSVPPVSFDEAEGELESIKCNGVEFKVHGNYFAKISPVYAEIQQTKKASLYLKCSEDSFRQFINACQKQPFNVSLENVEEIICLAGIFKIEKLIVILESIKKTLMQQKSFFDEIQSKINSLSKICAKQQIEIDELKRKQSSGVAIRRTFSSGTPIIEPFLPTTNIELKTIDFTGNPMKGIFFWLRQQTKDSLVASGFAKVTVSSMNHLSSSPDMLVENIRMCKWMSLARKKSWVKIDLLTHVLIIRAYTMRLPESNSILWCPISWVLEGSTDDISWTVVDEHRGNKVFTENVSRCTWTVTPAGPFRYLRLTQIESNRNEDNFFILCALEFFGTIQKRPDVFG